MNQERALLHFNKFKSLRDEYLRDTLQGLTYKLIKVRLIKNSETDYEVKLLVESEIDSVTSEIDSNYAHTNFKPID